MSNSKVKYMSVSTDMAVVTVERQAGRKVEAKKELKKHAATIHCSNTLSLLQRKITNALLYHAYHELMQKEEHIITVKQLCRLINYQGNNHAVIKEAIRGLLTTLLEWNLLDEKTGREKWTASSVIASVSVEGPDCFYAYSPRMKQLLYSPSMFGKIDLIIQSQFRSSYGLALYENCIRYRGLPYTKWVEMGLFKKLMGVPQDMYHIFRDFKRRVLDKAIDEVNMYSDLVIGAELLKDGRKITKIRFSLKDRAKKTRLGQMRMVERVPSITLKMTLIPKLIETFHLSEEQVDSLFMDYSAEKIDEKIQIIESSIAYQNGSIKSLSAYLLTALKQNYQSKQKKEWEQKQKLEQIKQKAHEWIKIAEGIRLQYTKQREESIYEAIEALENNERIQFMKRFYEYADAAIHIVLQLQRAKYTRETILESPHIKAQLRQFALRELSSMRLKTVEIFVAGLSAEKQEAWRQLRLYDPEHPALNAG